MLVSVEIALLVRYFNEMSLIHVNGKTRHSNIVRSINTIIFSTNSYVYVVLGYTISSNHTYYFDYAIYGWCLPLNL